MNVTIIGTGYVGLCTGAVLAEIGHTVRCIDNDEAKIAMLKEGRSPIYEPGLQELIDKHAPAGALAFETDIATGMTDAQVVIIAVSTPRSDTGEANLVYVENVSEQIAKNLAGYTVIVEKSTVPVRTGERVKQVIERNSTGDHPFDVVSNPEFLREGHAITDTMKADRIVVGVESERAAQVMRELYAPILEESGAAWIVTDIPTAETIKHASNSFLAMKISYINAIANICERCGADVRKVAEGMGLDNRIGPGFLDAGVGYGGSCFPKDVDAFIHIAGELGYDFKLLEAVREINEAQRGLFVAKIKDVLWNLEGKRIAVWGLTYKPNTDDMRNAPSIGIIEELVAGGAQVIAYDPKGMDKAKQVLPEAVEYAADAMSALDGADCLALVTEWDEFVTADLAKAKERMHFPLIADGRNLFEKSEVEALGFTYRGVGV